jgi:hypothetical protein
VGSKLCRKLWIPASPAEKAFSSPTTRELILTSWVDAAKTRRPTALRIRIDKRAATMANPFRDRAKNSIDPFSLL